MEPPPGIMEERSHSSLERAPLRADPVDERPATNTPTPMPRANWDRPAAHSARLYGSGRPSAKAEARRAAHTHRETAARTVFLTDAAPSPPAQPRPPTGTGRPGSRVADRNALPKAKPKAIHTEVRSGGMDIGCFQVERVLQDVEQKVREKGRKEELQRARWQRRTEKKRAEEHSRHVDMRGSHGKRKQTKQRIQALHDDTVPTHTVMLATAPREKAGMQLLVQILDEAGAQGRSLLGEAAGLPRAEAGQVQPEMLASELCVRCEGLSELVLDLTDQLTAGVMGIRPAAPPEYGGPPHTEMSMEFGVAAGWTQDEWLNAPHHIDKGIQHLSATHASRLGARLGAHPFADAETLDYILDQLLLTISSAAALATQSPRTSGSPLNETSPATPGSPLNVLDAVMAAGAKARDDAGESESAGAAARGGSSLWKQLNAKRKMAMVSNETVAQIAPFLLKYGLMDYARPLKKYGFHQLPALRKASIAQLVQLGMSSREAMILLRAVGASHPGEGEEGQTPEERRKSAGKGKRAHGIEIPNEAWFFKAELEPEPEQAPVLMSDLRPVSRHGLSSRGGRSTRDDRQAGKSSGDGAAIVGHGYTAPGAKPGDAGDAGNADGAAPAALDVGAVNSLRDLVQVGAAKDTKESLEKAAVDQREQAQSDYARLISRNRQSHLRDLKEEQEADAWLKAQPLKHRVKKPDPGKAVKGATINATLRKKIAPMPHMKGFSEHGNTNHTQVSGMGDTFGPVTESQSISRASNTSEHSGEMMREASVSNGFRVGAVGITAGMRFSQTSSSFAGQVFQHAASQDSLAHLAKLDGEILSAMSGAPRAQVYVGDPRFLPNDLSQAHRGVANYNGEDFIQRWSSLQMHSPRTIEERKQAMRVAKAWQPKTTRSFRVERALGA